MISPTIPATYPDLLKALANRMHPTENHVSSCDSGILFRGVLHVLISWFRPGYKVDILSPGEECWVPCRLECRPYGPQQLGSHQGQSVVPG